MSACGLVGWMSKLTSVTCLCEQFHRSQDVSVFFAPRKSTNSIVSFMDILLNEQTSSLTSWQKVTPSFPCKPCKPFTAFLIHKKAYGICDRVVMPEGKKKKEKTPLVMMTQQAWFMGGGDLGARTRHPPTAQTIKKILVWVRGIAYRSTRTQTLTVVACVILQCIPCFYEQMHVWWSDHSVCVSVF